MSPENKRQYLCTLFELGDGTTCKLTSDGLEFQKNGRVLVIDAAKVFDKLWYADGGRADVTDSLFKPTLLRVLTEAAQAEVLQYNTRPLDMSSPWKPANVELLVLLGTNIPFSCFRIAGIARTPPVAATHETRWLWASKTAGVSCYMYTESKRPMDYLIKLAWSATEFPV